MERRAARLQGEYRRPLHRLDQRYHATPEGQVGPLQRRLEGFGQLQGWVVGSFQEASKDLHHLLECLADSKLKARGLARGREGDEWERSLILHEFSLAAPKAVPACLARYPSLGMATGRQPGDEPGPSMKVTGEKLP